MHLADSPRPTAAGVEMGTGRASGELLKAWKTRGCDFPVDLGRELAEWGTQETVPTVTLMRATSSLYPKGIPS